MYFIFSKILLFLILPLNWIIAFLLIGFFSKKPKIKKTAFVISLILFVIFSNPYLLNLFARKYEIGPAQLNKGKVYSAVIVLGGFSGEDKNGNGYFNENASRFITGLKLRSTGHASHILISGGNGNLRQGNFSEAAWVKGELKALSIPDSVILTEQTSRNTIENAAFSKAILDKAHLPPPYLLVTSSWHMRRSLYIFRHEGLDVVPSSSGGLAANSRVTWVDILGFDAGTLSAWNIYMKEMVGLVATHIKYML